MSAGWVLVQTAGGAAPEVASVLAEMPDVVLAEQTAGAYDVVARVADGDPEVRNAKKVLKAALRVPGVTLAVCCHDGEAGPRETIDLTEPAADLEPAR